MNCQICGIEVTIPHTCHYCGGQFCSQHRLPENHTCPQINIARTQQQYTTNTTKTQTNNNYTYNFNFNPQQSTKKRQNIYSSPKELKHIGIAALLVIGIGVSIGIYSGWTIGMMAIFAVCMMASFLAHEIAHKITAQKHGLWAEFRLTLWGTLLTFASVFLPFKYIGPGAMMIRGTTNKKSILEISIAGPITNIIFSPISFAIAHILPIIGLPIHLAAVFMFVGYINAFIAIFNLIPIGILDGYKIFSVDKKIWATVFIPSLILIIYGYIILFM
ncbi:MAG: hypothetical protein LBE76_01865 [Nitrososphaerota archaeon]|jgi:Zn-dependent protease|nr:hypothetical protein [Nitrososphaerota archaeon]